MSFLAEFASYLRENRDDLEAAWADEGTTLRIAERGRLGDGSRPEFQVHETKRGLLLDWVWRLSATDAAPESLRDLLLDYVTDGIENHGWEVPVVLVGGPLHGKQLTKRWEDLVGRLMFARKGRNDGEPQRADLYKWRLQRSPTGEYVCVYERSLAGEDVDRFIARGVESTGPFVLIHDRG